MVNLCLLIKMLYSSIMTKQKKDNRRGLASADEETQERIAREGGEARAQDKEGLREAGRKGGEN
jgi:general stress protein YciG